MKYFQHEIDNGLIWLPELGIGRYPVPQDRPYDERYFDNYQKMANTLTGKKLTAARIDLIARHYEGSILDVGIGAGQFVSSREDTCGFDVNPVGIEWLKSRNKWADLYEDSYPALTFWDSLEHIDRPDLAVAKSLSWVFVSIPIFENAEHLICSKHYRKNEHIYYFTHDGLIRWFEEQGFSCKEHNRMECDLGRDGIGTYAFKRRE